MGQKFRCGFGDVSDCGSLMRLQTRHLQEWRRRKSWLDLEDLLPGKTLIFCYKLARGFSFSPHEPLHGLLACPQNMAADCLQDDGSSVARQKP